MQGLLITSPCQGSHGSCAYHCQGVSLECACAVMGMELAGSMAV